ncbi:MAG: hypothetical protein K2X86_02170 [Cytophagaceae bacterium]|nr:hypothetical protein [Cytophagaceae bacterium]
MKKTIWIAALLTIAGAAFFIYQYTRSREYEDPFNIIPENTLLILEASPLDQAFAELKSQKSWKNFSTLSLMSVFQNRVSQLDALLPKDEKQEFYKNKKLIFSLHVTSHDSLDCILYFPLPASGDERFIKNALSEILNRSDVTQEERKYNEITIHSFTFLKTKQKFSYTIYKNLFIGSFTEILIDDVIRNIVAKNSRAFWKREEVKSQKLINGKITLHIKYSRLPQSFSHFSFRPLKEFVSVTSFADQAMLEMNLSDKSLLLNGFTQAKPNDFIEIFKNQQAQPFLMRNYIPNNTSWVYYYGFDKPVLIGKGLKDYWAKNDPDLITEIESAHVEYNIDLSDLYGDMGKEAGVCSLGSDSATSEKLVFIHAPDPDRLFLHLGKIVTLASSVKKDKPDTELVKGTKIRQMNIEEFPRKLFGRNFSGFPVSYFAVIDDYVVFGKSKESIKNLIIDIEGENVWGKTLKMTGILEEAITEFNVGIFAQVKSLPKNGWLKDLAWSGKIDFAGVQFSHLQPSILTHVLLTSSDVAEETEAKDIVITDKVFPYFYLVENKSSGKDLIFQDQAFNLYLINEGLTAKWKKDFKYSILNTVYTIDIRKDKAPDYVFAAKNKIYAMDAKGNFHTGFPLSLAEGSYIRNISVVDYSNTGDYRIVVNDQNGDIYFYSLKGEILEGWNPKKLNGELCDRVKHLRVENKDMILAIQKNGQVHVYNRKGAPYPGFPLNLGVRLSDGAVVEKGNDFENTVINVVTEKNELIKVNLKGKIERQALNDFELVSDAKGAAFIFAKRAEGKITLYDNKKVQKFQVDKLSANTGVFYQEFSSSKQFVLVKDYDAKILYVYDMNGKLLLDKPCKSEAHSPVFFDENRKGYFMYNLIYSEDLQNSFELVALSNSNTN